MKNFIYLLLFVFISSCKSQQTNLETIKLPAYQPKNEISVVNSILNSTNLKNPPQLIINNKEYPFEDFQRIIDTLKISRYNIKIEKDIDSNEKILISKNS